MGAWARTEIERKPSTALRLELEQSGYTGDFEDGLGARQVAATDNSIYEVLPAAIAYPRERDDINRIVRAAGRIGGSLSVTARGGNTGTNGQSLNDGVIVDCARHLDRILALDVERRTVTVEPGVVLDQLNAALAPHGLFFPPTVSTASRATIGGMVSTDASGKGSRVYGKTSDHIASLDVVLADGSDWRVEDMTARDAERLAAGTGIVADAHREALRIVRDQADTIAATFPRMNRGLTGYNLQKCYDAANDRFSLAYLLAGAEGTLGIVKSATLRLAPKPSHRALVIVGYDDFGRGLDDVRRLLEVDPLAIEILDDKVLSAARADPVWTRIGTALGARITHGARALNFVEFVGFSAEEVSGCARRLEAMLDDGAAGTIGHVSIRDPETIATIWKLREKAVGLLAREREGRQGVPFVEDTAVPPERLSDYVGEFRALLDGRGLEYGMFGHADVGCLHVRPFLDMKELEQAALVRPLSDAVAALTKRYGGLLWGEHGRGFRGEYSPFFFGDPLYSELRRLKAAFDPRNLFNPGKLVSPPGAPEVDRIDRVPLRGMRDARIAEALRADLDRAVACNGNAACFSWDAFDAMCPSYKATRDRAQSPKGRAALLRAWGRLRSEGDPAEAAEIEDALHRSLATCLSCKACTTMCPVNVDIPAMKSRFLAHHYATRARPRRHALLRHSERMFALGRSVPRVANRVGRSRVVREASRRWLGIVDLPRFSSAAPTRVPVATPGAIEALPAAQRRRCVVLVEDSFTASFDRDVPDAAAAVLERLGYTPLRLPARNSGKLLHLIGMRAAFARVAEARIAECAALAATGASLIGLDAATMLMFEQEYREFGDIEFTVDGIEHLLSREIAAGMLGEPQAKGGPRHRLLGHCTETALRPDAPDQWATVLGHFGINAAPARTGCCGMAGLFGHEEANLVMSRRLFDMSWRGRIGNDPALVLATGYSCRSQAMRLAGVRLRHPIELLADRLHLRGTSA